MSAKKKPPKKKAGRKWFDGRSEEGVVALLCNKWGIGCPDAEAALYADILPCTLSRYLESHPKIKQRKEALLQRPFLLARETIVGAFDGHEIEVIIGRGKKKKKIKTKAYRDPDAAMKFMERKKKDEFSTRSEFTGADGAPLPVPTVHVYLPHNSRDPIPPTPAKPAPKGDKAG